MPAMHLDLCVHEITEAPGKVLDINGVEYIVRELADEGGETFIFPLENPRSRLILFLAKIYKFKPSSPEFNQRRQAAYNPFILSMVGVPTAHEEQYAIAGGLVKFQLHERGGMFLGHNSVRDSTPIERTAHDCRESIDRAKRLLLAGNRVTAAEILKSVIRTHPEHSEAMRMMAGVYLQLRRPAEVYSIVKEALAIEPNDVCLYHFGAKSRIALNEPDAALELLDRALRRYWWDWGSWELKREVATRYGLVDLIKDMAEEAQIRLDAEGHLGANDAMRATVVEDFRSRLDLKESFYRETDMAADVTYALGLLLQRPTEGSQDERFHDGLTRAQEAQRIVTSYRDFWLARVVWFISNSFFLYDAVAAADVYGGMEGMLHTMQTESVEQYYLRGLGALFRGEQREGLQLFQRAADLSPDDIYVQFGLVLGMAASNAAPQLTSEAFTKLYHLNSDHPVVGLARELFTSDDAMD